MIGSFGIISDITMYSQLEKKICPEEQNVGSQ